MRLEIADIGIGMSVQTLSAPWNRSSRQKTCNATGLGLAAASSFGEQSGGGFAIESELGRGTTATLWLPQAGVEERRPRPAIAARLTVKVPHLIGGR